MTEGNYIHHIISSVHTGRVPHTSCLLKNLCSDDNGSKLKAGAGLEIRCNIGERHRASLASTEGSPLAFNQRVPARSAKWPSSPARRASSQGKVGTGEKGRQQSVLGKTPCLLWLPAPRPGMRKAARPKDPANSLLKSAAVHMETTNILSYALGSEKMRSPNRRFFFSFILFIPFQ